MLGSVRRETKLQWLVAALIGAVLSAFTVMAQTAGSNGKVVERLDELVTKQDYRAAIRMLKSSSLTTAEQVEWLTRHAERGHVPLQNELALTLFPTDVEASVRWFARGRLGRTLDGAECDSPGDSLFSRLAIDDIVDKIRLAGVANPKLLYEASIEAMAREAPPEKRPSSTWICGGRLDKFQSADEREKRREKARSDMRAASKLIGDYVAAVEAGKSYPIKLYESNVRASPGWRSAGWLDNDRLLFAGYTSETPKGADLYMWDLRKAKVTRVDIGSERVTEICVIDGWVRIAYNDTSGARKVVGGKYPKLEEIAEPAGALVYGSRPDCTPALKSELSAKRFNTTLLRAVDGHIVVSNDRAPVHHRPNGEAVELPLPTGTGRVMQYAPWSGEYLLEGVVQDHVNGEVRLGPRNRGDDALLYLWHPKGATTQVRIPYGVWDEKNPFSSLYWPTRQGLIISDGRLDEDGVPNWNGLFLFRSEGGPLRLLPGRHEIRAVSPSGCSIAFNFSVYGRPAASSNMEPYRDLGPIESTKILDICAR